MDTFNITKRLALTAGARFNNAFRLQDRSGFNPDLNSASTYYRINPVVGATDEFAPAFSLYGGYSEANRAPAPLKHACSDPTRSWSAASTIWATSQTRTLSCL